MHDSDIDLLLASIWQGQAHPGVAKAPRAIAQSISDWAHQDHKPVPNTVAITPSASKDGVSVISDFCHKLCDEVQFSIQRGRFPITLGGDHSVGVGSVCGSLKADPNTLVIWVDAHADLNTLGSSPTGHFHGMPVAVLLGLEKTLPFDWIKSSLKPSHLIYIGTRDIDAGEALTLRRLGIRTYTMESLREQGVASVVHEIQAYAQALKIQSVHLSIDIDAWDPRVAESTGCHVPDGLNLEEGGELVRTLCAQLPVKACDLVEVNLDLGSEEAKRRTLLLATRLLQLVILSHSRMSILGVMPGWAKLWQNVTDTFERTFRRRRYGLG